MEGVQDPAEAIQDVRSEAVASEVSELKEQLRLLTERFTRLDMASSTVMGSSSSSRGTALEVRPVETDVAEALALSRSSVRSPFIPTLDPPNPTTNLPNSRGGGGRSPPPPIFNGHDFALFLRRFTRWAYLVGLDGSEDRVLRSWLIASVEGPALEVAEGIYDRTVSFGNLVTSMTMAFPTYVTDFTLRQDLARVSGIGKDTSMELFEAMIIRMEGIMSRMSPDAMSPQERYITFAHKNGSLWKYIRDNPLYRRFPATYVGLK